MSEIKKIIQKLHPLERKVIPKLRDGITYKILIKETGLQEVEVMRALQWLENKDVLKLENNNSSKIVLDSNGEKALDSGLPEDAFLKAVKEGADDLDEVIKIAKLDRQEASACIGLLKKSGRIDFANKKLSITKLGEDALKKESFEFLLIKKLGKNPVNIDDLEPQEKFAFDNLKKRKNIIKIVEEKDKLVQLTKLGHDLLKEDLSVNYADKITSEDIKTGAWENKDYRAYDVTINVPKVIPGKKHFVNESIDYIKQVWLELGFQEMTGNYIHTAFWDLDVLFVPQDHPAREMQDTFYLENPAKGKIDKKIFDKVKAVHESGGDTGSTGWQYEFSKSESEQLMLRTHTTVLSAETLAKIKEGKKSMPGKYFSVGKVFRNEALDWKHLFEFYQVEGIVVDPSANFKHLLGYLELFFKKLGFEKIRIRPGHFPYTEPSVEVDGYHPIKKEWVELGGAGMFRPEVTKTLLGEEVPVLAWGLGMGRIISEYFKISDIRDLYNNDLKQLRTMKKWVK